MSSTTPHVISTSTVFITVGLVLVLLRWRTKAHHPNRNHRVKLFCAAIDDINALDTRLEQDGSPTELIYSQRMSQMLIRMIPHAGELVQMACHAQHVGRWKIPRSLFPEGRNGYLQWRKKCQLMHTETALEVMRTKCAGMFTMEEEEELKHMLCKEDIKGDPLVQTIEDVAALVFLQWGFIPFCHKHSSEPDKIIDILKKTWAKMSNQGQTLATREIVPQLPQEQQQFITRAVAGDGNNTSA